MYRAYFLVLALLLNSFVGAQAVVPVTEEMRVACVTEMKEAFGNLSDDDIVKFVKLQTSITTHRLAWTHLTNLQESGRKNLRRDKNGQNLDKFEDGMKAIIEKDIAALANIQNTKEHEQAKAAFDKYSAGLSANSTRKVLAGMSPSLRKAIKRQLSNGSPSLYKINSGDIAILHLLAEGEKSYHHRYSKSVTGNLNIARMINSSLNGKTYEGDIKDHRGNFYTPEKKDSTAMTSADINSNLRVFENFIKLKEDELNDLITGMLPSNQSACHALKNACQNDSLKDSSLAGFLLSSDTISEMLNDQIETRSSDQEFKKKLLDALHYCNNWLHTNSKCLEKKFTDQHCNSDCQETERICDDKQPEDEKPEVKPEDEKPEVKPEDEKPEVKPEDEKPEVKPEDEKPANKNTTIYNNNVYIVMGSTQPIIPSGSISILPVSNPQQAAEYLKAYLNYNRGPQNGAGFYPYSNGTAGLNNGIVNGGGYNGSGNATYPNGNKEDKNSDNKKKDSSKSWGISLTSKMDKIFNAEGEDLFTVFTVGKKEYDYVCIKWKYPSDLGEMEQTKSFDKNFIAGIRAAGGSQSLAKLYAPYRKSSYKVSATLYECTSSNKLVKEIQTSTVEIKRAWQGGSFSCDWNPANINLKACLPVQSRQVPFKPFILNGTDGNQGF